MNNYQLYRTNAKLGGQIAWNIILGSTEGDLNVTNFCLSPYSPYASFAYNEDRDWLRYTHQENVSHLYKQIKGSFYDPCIDSRLSGHYPLLDEIPTKNTAEDYGIMRIPYKRFNKQFSILCPVWLEEFGPESVLEFEFILRPEPILDTDTNTLTYPVDNNGQEIEISKKVLVLDGNTKTHDLSTQNAFERYFFNYIDYISQEYANGELFTKFIGDDVINLNISNDKDSVSEYGAVTGLQVSSGNIITKDITSFIPNIYERERPLMELDSLIQSNISNNELIVKQLFNFNFIFNLDDLSNTTMLNLIGDSNKLNVDVRVKVNGKTLERRVFDTNYTYIKNSTISNEYETSVDTVSSLMKIQNSKDNVFNYLLDTKCIDLIKYNKVSQYIHHWSLTNNNDYIFNLYSGFAALSSGISSYFYKSAPNYWETDVHVFPNALNWCKNIHYKRSQDFRNSIINDVTNTYTNIDLSNSFVDYTKIDRITSDKNQIVHITSVTLNESLGVILDDIKNNFGSIVKSNIGIFYRSKNKDDQNDQYILEDNTHTDISNIINGGEYSDIFFMVRGFVDNALVIIAPTSNINTLSYKYFKENVVPACRVFMEKYSKERDIINYFTNLEVLCDFFDRVIEPSFIYIHNSLNYRRVDSPINTSDEIEYTKDNNSHNTLIRYLGTIKPTFSLKEKTQEFQFIHYNELNNTGVFDEGIKQNYLPYYPSIEYWYLKPIKSDNDVSSRNDYKYAVEDKWYEYSTVLNINPLINFTIYSELDASGDYYKIEDLIRNKIAEIYSNIEQDDRSYNYFMSLYDISSNFEYVEDEFGRPKFHDTEKKKFIYKYNVKLTLK